MQRKRSMNPWLWVSNEKDPWKPYGCPSVAAACWIHELKPSTPRMDPLHATTNIDSDCPGTFLRIGILISSSAGSTAMDFGLFLFPKKIYNLLEWNLLLHIPVPYLVIKIVFVSVFRSTNWPCKTIFTRWSSALCAPAAISMALLYVTPPEEFPSSPRYHGCFLPWSISWLAYWGSGTIPLWISCFSSYARCLF